MHCQNCTADFTHMNETLYAQRLSDPDTGTSSQIESECETEIEDGQVFITCGVCGEVTPYPVDETPLGNMLNPKGPVVREPAEDTHLLITPDVTHAPNEQSDHTQQVVTNVEVTSNIRTSQKPVGHIQFIIDIEYGNNDGREAPKAVNLTTRIAEGTSFSDLDSVEEWLKSCAEIIQLDLARSERIVGGDVRDIPLEESFGQLDNLFGAEVTGMEEL